MRPASPHPRMRMDPARRTGFAAAGPAVRRGAAQGGRGCARDQARPRRLERAGSECYLDGGDSRVTPGRPPRRLYSSSGHRGSRLHRLAALGLRRRRARQRAAAAQPEVELFEVEKHSPSEANRNPSGYGASPNEMPPSPSAGVGGEARQRAQVARLPECREPWLTVHVPTVGRAPMARKEGNSRGYALIDVVSERRAR